MSIQDYVVEQVDHKLFEDTPRRDAKSRGSSSRR
jgi:hypothetical protein